MAGLRFETRPAAPRAAPNRADVACFVGLVPLRGAAGSDVKPSGMDPPGAIPEALESWEAFDQRFAWDRRPLAGLAPLSCQAERRGAFCATYMGAAVRSFFAQGGRRCFVVRVADPPPTRPLMPSDADLEADRRERDGLLRALLPGYPGGLSPTPLDPSSWTGVGALFGLPEVSFVALPDLADLLAVSRRAIPPLIPSPLPEAFVDCGDAEPSFQDWQGPRLEAPRCDAAGVRDWGTAILAVVAFLRRWRREVQLVAALPLPVEGGDARDALVPSLASGFFQAVYPWVRTPLSQQLPGGLEAPEGVLAGVLARNALSRGGFRAAAGLALGDVVAVEPVLTRAQRLAPLASAAAEGSSAPTFQDRVSLLGPSSSGPRLLSDVTTSLDPTWRLASVHRLMTALVRAARSLGELHTFEVSGEALWGLLRDNLETMLTALWQNGALAGGSAAEAFSVRCDRSTMSEQDLDSGRVVAEVVFLPALPIEEISVQLAMDEGGQVTLHRTPP
jgi:hypothetical protein